MSFQPPSPPAWEQPLSNSHPHNSSPPHLYFQQTTSSVLYSTIVFTFLGTLIGLVLFSWVRTKRSSIYGSRQFFVREEHRADPLPDSFWGWVPSLFFLERSIERRLLAAEAEVEDANARTTTPSSTATTDVQGRIAAAEEGSSSRDQNTQHSLTEKGEEGSTPTSNNNTNNTNINVNIGRGIWRHLRGLFASGKTSLFSVIRPLDNTTTSATTNEEIGATNDESNALATGSTLKPPQTHSTISAAATNTTHLHQPTQQKQHPLDGGSAEKASTLARQAIIAKIGLDHYLLIRFLKMLFSISVVLGIIAISSLVPLYVIDQTGEGLQSNRNNDDDLSGPAGSQPMRRVEMLQIGNVTDIRRLWAAVLAVTVFSALILAWSWSELMMYLKLRQEFLFRSASRYSSRVVLLQNLPQNLRTVESLKELFATAPGGGVEHVYLVRDVSRLEKAVKQRQVVLDKLEETESRYMNAIARASAMVSFTTLNMRSPSWLGRCVDNVKSCFGYGGSGAFGDNGGKHSEEGDYVGHLKLYQLGDVPKLSLTDLSSPAAIPHQQQQQRTAVSNVSNSGGLAVLKWYQKPRRPRHYVGMPLFSKRQDSIRYYRGELCRLNKVIEQEYELQAKAMADDHQGTRQSRVYRLNQGRARPANINESVVVVDDVATVSEGEKTGVSAKGSQSSQVNTLPSAFILMRTRAGAKAVAFDTIGQDKIPLDSRILNIPPRDIEWRVLGQATSTLANVVKRTMIMSVGLLLVVGCGLAVSAIASMTVFNGWERVVEEEAEVLVGPAVYLRQGVLAPMLLALLMLAGSWILNELCQYWGRVSKMQTELLTQQWSSYFLLINIFIVHPIVSLSLSWQESSFTEVDSLASFLVHAIPSYCSFAFSYILTAGLMLPLHHILQFSRLWATLPAVTLWSALGPLSWRKSNRLHKSKSHRQHNTESDSTTGKKTDSTTSTTTSSNSDASFEDNFSSAPTQTPRQAFQTRQPPFFNLQNLYPHLVLMFTISLALLPLAPLFFLFWIVVLMGMNLCYRYLVLQVVTTKSQSGGLHYLQAIKFLLFPTLACPPLLLAVYLGIRQAWVQAGFSIVLLLAALALRYVVGVQFEKREEMMLKRVEDYHLQPKALLLHSKKAPGRVGNRPGKSRAATGAVAAVGHEAGSMGSDPRGFSSDSDGKGPSTTSSHDLDENGKGIPAPRQRLIKRMIQRPTTIIGQYRSSFVSTISGGARPKSMPLFDLERYEKEILGVFDRDTQADLGDGGGGSSTGGGSQQEASGQATSLCQDKVHSRHPSLARAQTIGHGAVHGRTASSTGFEPGFSFADGTDVSEMNDMFSGYSKMAQRAIVEGSALSKAEEEEVEKEAKYREIVKALRRASSVASRRRFDAATSTTNNSNTATGGTNQQRRVRMASSTGFASSSLETVNETRTTSQFTKRSMPNITGTSNNKAQFRTSLPGLLNPRPLHYANNPYLLHQRSIDNALSNVSMSSGISSSVFRNGRGAPPSLPMLLIHRESVAVAKEQSRIQGLYLNPVLQEAKTRVVVWLPSQTEQSFWGSSSSSWSGIHDHQQRQDGESPSAGTVSPLGHCKYHAALKVREDNEVTDLAISNASGASGDDVEGSHSATTPNQGRSTFGLSTSTLTPVAQDVPSVHRHQCTCALYQEVMKAVADAVALADQEIRDLRIVGLTVWLDSRHVVWGQDKEEDGRLGDRVMIATSPSMQFGGAQQRHVGDGLLSWLEVDEDLDTEGGEGGETMHSSHLGKGAAGIIGGSMGVIMRRPIGCYGRLVGDGEDDDITRGLSFA